MSESNQRPIEVEIRARSRNLPGFESSRGFAAAHRTGGAPGGFGKNGLVLLLSEAGVGDRVQVDEASCIEIGAPPDTTLALLAVPLALAFSFWEATGLELGDAAVFTSSGPLARLTGHTALWRGGCPVVQLGPPDAEKDKDITLIDWNDHEEASKALFEMTGKRPGFAAVELSGRAEVIDTVLEIMPRWSRLVLASASAMPVTIDYYKNVHRKGAVISTTVGEPAILFNPKLGGAVRAQIQYAIQWLENPVRASQCMSAMGLI